jgi:hypothetical protein
VNWRLSTVKIGQEVWFQAQLGSLPTSWTDVGVVDPFVAPAAGRVAVSGGGSARTGTADRRIKVAESRGNCKGKHVMNVELMLSQALAANDAGLMACYDRNSFHPEEFGRGGLAPGQSLDSAKRTQQVTVFSMNQV